MTGGDGTEVGHAVPRGKQEEEERLTETDMGDGVDTNPVSWLYAYLRIGIWGGGKGRYYNHINRSQLNSAPIIYGMSRMR